jgi:hypothetical protein
MIATAHSALAKQSVPWVRTVDGWERLDSWHECKVAPPQLHPLVVAAGQGLVSLLGLAACPRGRSSQGDR